MLDDIVHFSLMSSEDFIIAFPELIGIHASQQLQMSMCSFKCMSASSEAVFILYRSMNVAVKVVKEVRMRNGALETVEKAKSTYFYP
jgi:hypothetical protein